MDRVFAVTRNYNNEEMTRGCIEEIQNAGLSSANIIVVDDCSTDASLGNLKADFQNVKFVEMARFSEYCICFNRGIESAIANGADYIQIINNDIRNISPNFFREMVNTFKLHPRIGLVGSKVFDYHENVLTGIKPSIRMGLYVNVPTEGYMFSKEVIENVGLFDEKLVRHLEDYDYIHRMRTLGFLTQYCDTASFEHLGGGTSSKMLVVPNYYRMRNIVWYLKRYGYNYSWLQKLRIALGFGNKCAAIINKKANEGKYFDAMIVLSAAVSGLLAGYLRKW